MRRVVFFSLLTLFIAGYVAAAFACERMPKVLHDNGLYIVKVNYETKHIYPYVAKELRTVKDMALRSNAEVAINAGFFDAKNQKTVSYVTLNGQILADPTKNENLTSNEKLQPYLDRIYNRGEIRFYNCGGEKKADITYHEDEYLSDCELMSSIQAGPILLPEMDLEKEYFVIKRDGKVIRDGAGLTRRTDRSMIGIKGKYIYFIITDENSPLTIYELQNKVKKLGLEKALAFDGGGSVSLYVKKKQYVKLSDDYFYQDREEKGASREVKSALIIRDKEIIPPDVRSLLMSGE